MRFPFPISLVLLVSVSGAIGWGMTRALDQKPRLPVARRAADVRARRALHPAPPRRTALPRGWSYVAVARAHRLTFHRRPRSGRVVARLRSPTAGGIPVTLLVKRARGRWVETYLPIRPNGRVGWVRLRAVRLRANPWSLALDLREHRLVVRHGRRVVRVLPAAAGKASTPTPHGTFFITALLKQPDPGGSYGPYAFGTSAHSEVLRRFGDGDGRIGLHGTDEPWMIGMAVSHGCIRLYNRDVRWLARRLPLGTPLRISRG